MRYRDDTSAGRPRGIATPTGRRTVTLARLPHGREAESRLREVLRRVLDEALAPGLALGLLACSGRPLATGVDGARLGDDGFGPTVDARVADPRDGPGAPGAWERIACEGGTWNPVAGLSPGEPADFVAALRGYAPDMILGASGEICRTATNRAQCMHDAIHELAMPLTMPPRCGPAGCLPYLVVTRGDRVARIATEAELLAFLGRIDTPQEAALVAFFSGYEFDCGDPERGSTRSVPGGFEVKATRRISDCPVTYATTVALVTAEGRIIEQSQRVIDARGGVCIGRRPEGLLPAAGTAPPWTLATYLASSAELEAASVPAFVDLARDLGRLGAPLDLVRDARRAACDEARHASMVSALAAARGVPVPAPVVETARPKDVLRLAVDNAVEGCVRETFGALCAGYQARVAADRDMARTMAELQEDEARHALLAWRIAGWLEPQLDERARRDLRDVRRQAVQDLRREIEHAHAPEVYALAGWPRPEVARTLVDALERWLWLVPAQSAAAGEALPVTTSRPRVPAFAH